MFLHAPGNFRNRVHASQCTRMSARSVIAYSLRLSSTLFLGPSWLKQRSEALVVARKPAAIFASSVSYTCSDTAAAGDVFFAKTFSRSVHGYQMVSLPGHGAIEARFIRLASRADTQLPSHVALIDLDSTRRPRGAPSTASRVTRRPRAAGRPMHNWAPSPAHFPEAVPAAELVSEVSVGQQRIKPEPNASGRHHWRHAATACQPLPCVPQACSKKCRSDVSLVNRVPCMPSFLPVATRSVAPLNLMPCSGLPSSSGLGQGLRPLFLFPKVLGATATRVEPVLGASSSKRSNCGRQPRTCTRRRMGRARFNRARHLARAAAYVSTSETVRPVYRPCFQLDLSCSEEGAHQRRAKASLPDAKSTEPELAQVALRSLYLKLAAVASSPREHDPSAMPAVPTLMPAHHVEHPLECRQHLAVTASLAGTKDTKKQTESGLPSCVLARVLLCTLYTKVAAVATPCRDHDPSAMHQLPADCRQEHQCQFPNRSLASPSNLPCDWASTYLSATGLRRVANEVSSHCFWHAQKHLTGMSVAQAMREVQQASGLDVANTVDMYLPDRYHCAIAARVLCQRPRHPPRSVCGCLLFFAQTVPQGICQCLM